MTPSKGARNREKHLPTYSFPLEIKRGGGFQGSEIKTSESAA